ncbi:MAG: hypothetical protein DWQ19_12835 [Crenarchaeota archaeon]|nr:MAG: hypothetical protein DWQ19_12835 [Thermoproteota archaeon]
MPSQVRDFKVFWYGRLLGVLRAAKPETIFSQAAKKWPHLISAEMDIQDSWVGRRGERAFYLRPFEKQLDRLAA